MPRFWQLIEKIQSDRHFISFALALLSVLMLYLNISFFHSVFLGCLFFVIYLLINSAWSAVFLAKFFSWTRGWAFFFGVFWFLNLAGLLLALPIDFFRFHSGLISLVFLILIFTNRILIALPYFSKNEILEKDAGLYKKPKEVYHTQRYLVMIFPALFFLGFMFLLQGRSGDFILSPWETTPRLYLYVYLLLTVVVSLLIFSKKNAKSLLLIIILHSFLLHAYLPFVYETGFGGDKWRHLASENFIKTGQVYQPALIGEVEYANLGSLKIPAVFVSGNKTSYGHQWALTIMLSESLQVDVFWIDFWLIFIIWSLFLPPLLYQLAGLIRPGRNFRLLLAFLPVLFYPLQVFGSITLPVSLGHLLFVFVLYSWIYFYKNRGKGLVVFNILASLLMYLGYVLYFILVWEVVLAVVVFKYFKIEKIKKIPSFFTKSSLIIFLFLFIPFLELFQGFGVWKENSSSFTGVFSNLADAFGHLSGLVAFLPQPSHVDQGNFLFNQTRADHAPVSFLSFRLWPLLFTVLIWMIAAYGWRCIKFLKKKEIPSLFAILLSSALVNYIISWYFFDGNHILARRLDQTIVFYLSIFIALGIMFFLERTMYMPWSNKVLLTAIIFGFVATSTYASGPHLQVVTKAEHQAAKYIWQKIDKRDDYYCVIANTWPLLALETESARAIIGGGFPVGFEYSQAERVRIYEKMSQHPDLDLFYWAKEITHDDVCYYMNEDRWINDRVYKETVDLLGEPERNFDDVYIWRF